MLLFFLTFNSFFSIFSLPKSEFLSLSPDQSVVGGEPMKRILLSILIGELKECGTAGKPGGKQTTQASNLSYRKKPVYSIRYITSLSPLPKMKIVSFCLMLSALLGLALLVACYPRLPMRSHPSHPPSHISRPIAETPATGHRGKWNYYPRSVGRQYPGQQRDFLQAKQQWRRHLGNGSKPVQ